MAKLDEDPNRLAEIADVLLMIHPMGALLLSLHGPCNACCPAGTSYEAGYSANGLTTAWCLTSNQSSLQRGSVREEETSSVAKKGCYGVGSWVYVHKARD